MNILEITLGSKTGKIRLLNDSQILWNEAFDYQSYEEAIESFIAIVKASKISFDGGTILLEENTFPFNQGCFPTSNGGYEGIIKTVSEGLNQPFLLNIPISSPSFFIELHHARKKSIWKLTYYGIHPGKEEYCVETLLTVGNGYMGLRGTLPEMEISYATYPATYLAGLYNAAKSVVADQIVSNEDFINAPNLQYLSFSIEDGNPIQITPENTRFLYRELDMKTGLFSSTYCYQDQENRQVEIQAKRLVSLKNRHEYRISYQIKPLNFEGELTVFSKADGGVYNYNVERYRTLTSKHLQVDQIEVGLKDALLVAHTLQSNQTIVQKSSFNIDPSLSEDMILVTKTDTCATQQISFYATCGTSYTFEKTVEVAVFSPDQTGQIRSFIAKSFQSNTFSEAHEEEIPLWENLWKESEITIKGDMLSQKFIHLHAFHLMVSATFTGNNGIDASVTARGLHGEGYRGHIFWDELFIFPFYNYHFPETARQLLCYRLNRLETAKENAQKAGYAGAMFPWQSGASGEEETQEIHLNPLTGVWGDDHSRLQRHVSIAIAYNIWKYYRLTGDRSLLEEKGAETYVEILRFWESITEYDPNDGRYHIDGVMGPDEFHESFPGNSKPGLQDNAYTNIMVVWMIEELPTILSGLSQARKDELFAKAGFTPERFNKLESMKKQLALEISPEGIIAQFKGFFQLKQVDWDYYRQKYGNIYRMDRILLAEGESADEYQVSKQADLFMVFYLLPKERIVEILSHLGYTLPSDFEQQNYAYYLDRTSHGSTLSRVVYSATGWQIGEKEKAWPMYQQALASDYNDIQGGTTAEGIHTGVMAATLAMVLERYAGLNLDHEFPVFQPNLPKEWDEIAFSFHFRSITYKVVVTLDSLTVTASDNTYIKVDGKEYRVKKEQEKAILWKGRECE